VTSGPWTNEQVIAEWGEVPGEVLAAIGPYGDFAKEHLLNNPMLRLLGDVSGKRVLDAGARGWLTERSSGASTCTNTRAWCRTRPTFTDPCRSTSTS